MHPYRYQVSLRLWHPNRDLSGATRVFRLRPRFLRKAGEPRQTPKGTPLPGIWRESYWSAELTPRKGIWSKRMDLETFLAKSLKRLSPKRAYISRLRATDGRADLFIGLFGNGSFGAELQPDLLAAAARVGIALSLDVYPD